MEDKYNTTEKKIIGEKINWKQSKEVIAPHFISYLKE